jgi:hypothetical protein
MIKNVKFDLDRNNIYITYSSEDYDRTTIDCILKMKLYGKVTIQDWDQIWIDMNRYKTTEMINHKNSINNIKLH